LAAVGEEVAFGLVGTTRHVRIRPCRNAAPLASIRSGILEGGGHVVLVHVEDDRDPCARETGNGSVKHMEIRSIPPVDDAAGGIDPRSSRLEVRPAQSQANRVEALPADLPVLGGPGGEPTLATRIGVRAVIPLSTDQPRL